MLESRLLEVRAEQHSSAELEVPIQSKTSAGKQQNNRPLSLTVVMHAACTRAHKHVDTHARAHVSVMLAPQRAMAKARLEKASLDDDIAKLKAKNDELSQQNGELEADNDEFQCPLHSTALRCASVVRCCGLPSAVVPTSVDRSDSVRTERPSRRPQYQPDVS